MSEPMPPRDCAPCVMMEQRLPISVRRRQDNCLSSPRYIVRELNCFPNSSQIVAEQISGSFPGFAVGSLYANEWADVRPRMPDTPSDIAFGSHATSVEHPSYDQVSHSRVLESFVTFSLSTSRSPHIVTCRNLHHSQSRTVVYQRPERR